MNISTRTRWTLALLAIATTVSSGCCCFTRKGIVLRGDWSLELNRVPHMRSNGPTYDADCCETVGCTTCTSGGCADGGCTCLGGVCNGACNGMYYGDGGGYGPSGGGGTGGAGGGFDGEGIPQPPQPTPAAQSRFHPVPTRPVFEPEGATYGPDFHAPTIPNISQAPAADATSRRRAPTTSRTTARRRNSSVGTTSARPTADLAAAGGNAQVDFAAYESEVTAEPEADTAAALETTGASLNPAPAKNTVAWHAPIRRR